MTPFRDNPSDAETKRELTLQELRTYRRLVFVGMAGLLSVVGVLVAFIYDLIPPRGTLQMWAFAYMVVGLIGYAVILIVGLSNGRDHRPGLIEMLAAAGRR